MKTLLFFALLFIAVEVFAANPTFQSFDTNAFIVNQSGNSIGANTSGGNPNALVKQSQITAGGISLTQATNAAQGVFALSNAAVVIPEINSSSNLLYGNLFSTNTITATNQPFSVGQALVVIRRNK